MNPIFHFRHHSAARWSLLLFLPALVGLLTLTARPGWGAPQERLASPETLAPSLIQPAPLRLVIYSAPGDPYAPLAEEIAAAESAPLEHDLAAALNLHPAALMWVAAPAALSDAVMLDFARAFQSQLEAPAVGLITGSTLEKARALWQRRGQVRGQRQVMVNARFPAAHIEKGQLIAIQPDQTVVEPLTKNRLASALQSADYLTYTGHGASKYLRLDEETTLTAADVPPLNAVVISTGSCQTVRLWDPASIALRMVDQGAAAYAGFVYSPMEGYLIGEFDDLPYRYTWPDYPIGMVVQAQERGTLQSFASLPFHILVGDPRIALQSQPPYHLASDTQNGDQRTLVYTSVPTGAIPVRIPGGADYAFVDVQGVSAASQNDPFYNSRLQMVNLHGDKYLLVEQAKNTGALTITLRKQPPFGWAAADRLLDALDHTLVFNPQSSGDALALAFSILPLGWLGLQALKRRIHRRDLLLALAFGLGAALLHGLYLLLRLPQVTINSKIIVFSPLSLAGDFLLAASGALIALPAKKWIGRLIGLLVITFNGWAPLLIVLAVFLVYNLGFFKPLLGVELYTYTLAWLPGIAWLALTALALAALAGLRRWRNAPPRTLAPQRSSFAPSGAPSGDDLPRSAR